MSKKHKGVVKTTKKGARKALKTAKKHGPFTAALLALAGVASSVLASERFKSGMDELVNKLMTRASNALDRVQSTTSDALARVTGSEDDESAEDEAASVPA
jgi:hypothetical protein